MRFYTLPEHPLRIYIDEEYSGDMEKLNRSLEGKYSPPANTYLHMDSLEEEAMSLIFRDHTLMKDYIVPGLLNIIIKEAQDLGISCINEVEVENIGEYESLTIDKNMLEGITLRDYQLEGIISSLVHKRGIIQVHTGGGKTEMMIGVCSYLLSSTSMNIILCVPTTNLLYQTYERLVARGVPNEEISLLGDGHSLDPNRRVLVSTVQSAYSKLDVNKSYKEWLSKVDCLMMDEAHHSKCRTWSNLIDRLAPTYILGFSAEPFHRDKSHIISDLILRGLLGPIIHRVTIEYLVEKGYLSKPYVVAVDSQYSGNLYSVVDWTLINKSCIVRNKLRNELITNISEVLINKVKYPLILVQQISHGEELAKLISKRGYSVTMMTGGLSVKQYVDGKIISQYKDSDNKVIADFNEGKIEVLIGTSTLDEGVDIPALSSVILAGGGKGRLKTIQKIGRGLRPKVGDNTTIIIDFRDKFNVVTSSHYKKRKAMFDELAIPVYYLTSLDDIDNLIATMSESSKQG